jgi:RNA polymerase sigma factor (sigma-70 family)
VEELETLVIRAQKGDGSAYGTLIQRFQDMAVGYAYAILGDLQLAEDVTQEAFLEAYRHLPSLRDPAAFPGWFRRIIFTQISRLKRSGKVETLSLDHLVEVTSVQPGPVEVVEKVEAQATIFKAVQSLPEPQRTVITLFYINEYSQKEISAFLEIPVATVKTRLYAARKGLKERIGAMIQDNLSTQRPTKKVMALFKAIADDEREAVKTLLAEDASLANGIGLEWSDYWHGQAAALHVAIMHQRKEIIELLLAHGADINLKEKQGWTALNFAVDMAYSGIAGYNFTEMFDFLRVRGAKEDIFIYIWLNDYEGIKAYLETNPGSANAIGPNHATPLCYIGDEKTAQLLLEHGADMFIKLDDRWCQERGVDTPLRWAASRPENPSLFRFLLEKGQVEIDLHLACALGDVAQVEAFLKSEPASIQTRTGPDHVLQADFTPLHVAARYRQLEVTKLLLEAGAEVNATTSSVKDMTPLHLAVWLSAGDEMVIRPELPRLLLEHGADTGARDSERKMTPLEWAEARHEDEEKDRTEVAALLRQFEQRS